MAYSTFGKFLPKRFFEDKSPGRESENRRVFTGDGGLGGLEPPTAPLSGMRPPHNIRLGRH